MDAEANPTSPEINREKFLTAIRKIFVIGETFPEKDVLQKFDQYGITPAEIDQILQELNLPDKEFRPQFLAAVEETAKTSKQHKNIVKRIPGLHYLTVVFNALNKNAGELAPEIVELRWQIRFQIALLLKPEVIRDLEAFLKKEPFRDRKFTFNQIGPTVSAFIHKNRETRDPKIVLPEILVDQGDIDELLSRSHEIVKPEPEKVEPKENPLGEIVFTLNPRNRASNWETLNVEIHNARLRHLKFNKIVACFEGSPEDYPELNRILSATYSKTAIAIRVKAIPKIERELKKIQKELRGRAANTAEEGSPEIFTKNLKFFTDAPATNWMTLNRKVFQTGLLGTIDLKRDVLPAVRSNSKCVLLKKIFDLNPKEENNIVEIDEEEDFLTLVEELKILKTELGHLVKPAYVGDGKDQMHAASGAEAERSTMF